MKSIYLGFTDHFVPYVRMTQRSKFVNKQARRYLRSRGRLRDCFREQMEGKELLGKVPLTVSIHIMMPGRLHGQDLDNQGKAILDAMNGIVFPDDRWVDSIKLERGLNKKWRVSIIVSERRNGDLI